MSRRMVRGGVTLGVALVVALVLLVIYASDDAEPVDVALLQPTPTPIAATATAAPATVTPQATPATPSPSPTATAAPASPTAVPTTPGQLVANPPTTPGQKAGTGPLAASATLVDTAGSPIAGAYAVSQDAWARSAADGRFRLEGLSSGAQVTVRAAGYQTLRLPAADLNGATLKLKPFDAKGLYLTFYMTSWVERRDYLLNLVRRTELNSVVIDVKSDQGLVNEAVSVPLAKQLGASTKLLDDFPGFIAGLKKDGIYTIARVVVFKDKKLAQGRPELAVRDTGRGGSYIDCEEQLWADPFNKEVWEYNLAIAEAAVKAGFDEIQFDYIRFPSDCISGSLAYSQVATPETRVHAVEGFLAAASARLRPLGAFVSADIFGEMTHIVEEDNIGQHLETIARQVDYVYPMVYPSTWVPGSFGYDYPAANPYDIVYQSTAEAVQRVAGMPGVRIRLWLQDFHDYGPRKLSYGATQLAQQIQASDKAGANGWMLWGPTGQYSEGALK